MAARIVSLVPSLTELLCSMGLRPQLVGRTGFCVHPRAELADVPKVGGTKAVDIERIRALAPTHLVVSKEENQAPVVAELASFIPQIVVTDVISLADNIALYRQIGDVFDRHAEATRLVAQFEQARARLLSRQDLPLGVLYLIWKSPWMTVTRNTFISQMLDAVGLQTVPAVDGVSDAARYPVLADEAFGDLAPQVVLLSTEPYRFTARHAADVGSLPDMGSVPCRLIDGEMTSWYGSRAIAGLNYLGEFRDALNQEHV